MLKTNLGLLDKAIAKERLINGNIQSTIQRSAIIPADSSSLEIGAILKNLRLFRVPYCIEMALNNSHEEQERYLHFITLPDGRPLLWLLITSDGDLIQQAFCRNNRNYPSVCKSVVRHLVCQARETQSEVA
jgi:hypothetical protein